MFNKSISISISSIILLVILESCNVTPVPIEYGSDMCHYCKMTIVDTKHAAEMVTEKGKPFKYDAIECMIADLKKRPDENFRLLMVSDFMSDAKLINAYVSTYLICEAIPSPMGANLTAFESETHATKTRLEKGGEIYTFDKILEVLK